MKITQLTACLLPVAALALFAWNPTAGAQTATASTSKHTAAPAMAPPSPTQMVDALHTAFGDHYVRAVHAKGIMATGTFEPSAQALTLTKAALFRGHQLPVLVRFSDFTGIPDIPDNVGDSNPRGLAIKFTLPGGTTSDIVTHSFNGFPTATTAEFRELLLAIGASGAGASKPTAIERFLGSHPIAKTFLTTQKPPSTSYGTVSYFGVNSFRFTGTDGKQRFVRYRFVPAGGEVFLSADALKKAGPNYLQEELPKHLQKAPIRFTWYAQIAEASDAIEDPSIAWPESRRLVELGTIRITRMAPNQDALQHATMFLPLNVPDGIAAADPMLGIRHSAYPISFAHRQQSGPEGAKK